MIYHSSDCTVQHKVAEVLVCSVREGDVNGSLKAADLRILLANERARYEKLLLQVRIGS